MSAGAPSGFYNVGTGEARSFNDLAATLFRAARQPPRIVWIETPPAVRENYQYFTRADVSKLRAAGYRRPFTTLEDGVTRYVESLAQEGARDLGATKT